MSLTIKDSKLDQRKYGGVKGESNHANDDHADAS